MRTALIVDPSLVSRTGHHYNAAKALIAEVESRGWRARTLVSRRANRDVLSELAAANCFTRSVYDRTDWTETGYTFECNAFSKILKRQLVGVNPLPTVVILPSCNQVQLSGLAHVIDGLKPLWNPIVMAWLLFPPKMFVRADGSSVLPQHDEYRRAFSKLRSLLKKDDALHIICETATLAKTYQDLSGQSVQLLYPPYDLEMSTSATPRRQSKRDIHLVVTGHANLNKGYALLPEALGRVVRRHRNVRATIHGDVNGTGNPNILELMKSIADVGPKISVRTESLSTDDYYDLLRSADLVMLPYDPKSYAHRGSGVFFEATTLGIPTVAPLHCDFAAAAIEQRRAVGIEAHDSASLSEAILTAIKGLNGLTANARSYAVKLGTETSSSDVIAAILRSGEQAEVAMFRDGLINELWQSIKTTYKKIHRWKF